MTAKWKADIYDTLKAAETAIETIDESKRIHLISFLDGGLQKAGVVNQA